MNLARVEQYFSDFLSAMEQMKRLGPISKLLGMIPGMGDIQKQLEPGQMEGQMKKIEAMIFSMTPQERRNPKVLNGSRKRRIAKGSGTSVQEINQLLKQFREMQKFIKKM